MYGLSDNDYKGATDGSTLIEEKVSFLNMWEILKNEELKGPTPWWIDVNWAIEKKNRLAVAGEHITFKR